MVFTYRTRVGDPDPAELDPVEKYHQELLLDESVVDEQHAAQFRVLIDLVIHWRKRVAPIAVKRLAVEPVLVDPANEGHPAYNSWLLQYEQMCKDEEAELIHVVIETWHCHRIWQHFEIPYRRRELGFDALTGVHCAEKELGRHLPFINKGPIHEAAPLPANYEPPEGFIDRLVPNFKNMLNVCPF